MLETIDRMVPPDSRGRRLLAWGLVAWTGVGIAIVLWLVVQALSRVAAIFPFFLVVREILDKPREESMGAIIVRAVRRTAPFFATIVIYLGMRYYVLGFLRRDEPSAASIPAIQVLITIPSIMLSYARMLFAPYPLAVMYGNKYVPSISDVRFFGAALAIAAILGVAIWFVRDSPVGRRALAFLILFLVPVFNLKAFRADESLLHDRYLYLPSIGFCILLAMALEQISTRFAANKQRVFLTATSIAAAVFLGLTFYQNFTWQNEVAMTNNALKVTPRWPFLYNYIGAHYADQHKYAEAEKAYLDAIDINPKYYDACSNLGDIYREQGRLAEAEQNYLKAIEYSAPYADTRYNLGVTYTSEGRYEDATRVLIDALAIDPANAAARYNLGWNYDHIGKADLAEQAYVETLRYKPSYPEPRINLGVLLSRQGRNDEALSQLQTAQRYAPDHPVLLYALGDVLLKLKRYNEAIAQFNQLIPRDPQNKLVYTSLGLCYEALGNRSEAKAQFEKAIQVAPQEPYTNTAREHLAKL